LYTLLIDPELAGITSDQLTLSLHERAIGTGVHYRSLHVHRYYQERFGYRPGDFPNAYRIGERTVSIPLSPLLKDDEVERITEAVRDVLVRKTLQSSR
jgi:dTDP-4-amino-4,6-dideoxygalactose transaminase